MKIFYIVIILILAVIAGYFAFDLDSQSPQKEINSFEDCTAAGYPVMESYPRQCQTPEGTVFTEEVENQNRDLIKEKILGTWQNIGDPKNTLEFQENGKVIGR